MRIVSTIAMMLVVAAAGTAIEGRIGEIIYMEGSPEIIREGDVVFDTIYFGFPLENFDSIRTDLHSSLELVLDRETGINGSITVQPNTQFHLNISSLRSEQVGSVELVTGSIGVVARELSGRSRFQVRTHSSVALVRGTEFGVDTAVGGEVLISTHEGLVEVTDMQGDTLFAAPGEAVEVDTDRNLMRNISYRRDALEDFRRQWAEARMDAFTANAPRVLRFYGLRYLESSRQFAQAFEELMSHRATVDRWIEESRRGIIDGTRPLLHDEQQLAGALLQVSGAMFTFEHTIARLVQMAAHARDISGTVRLGDGARTGSHTVSSVYDQIALERDLVRWRLATVRHILKLYAERNDGLIPIEAPSGFEAGGSSEGGDFVDDDGSVGEDAQ